MDTTTKTLFLILISIVAVYVLFTVIPLLARTLLRKISVCTIRSGGENGLVNSFLRETHPGKFFVALIGVGLLRSIKTINHGSEFPDDKQTETFRRFGTPTIVQALDEIGDGV